MQSGKCEGDMERVSEGRPREERAEFIITSASSRYVAGKMAREGWKPGIGRENQEKDLERERAERKKRGRKKGRDLARNALREGAALAYA